MIVIPAVDLIDGRVVRLLRGKFDQDTVYSNNPKEVARRWLNDGAELLHVVDLDGARQGKPAQMDLLAELAKLGGIQVGGGVRNRNDIEALLAAGVERVVIGTAALNRELITDLVTTYEERIVVALDTREGKVSTAGWEETSNRELSEVAPELVQLGARRFLHTDIQRDGALSGPNLQSLSSLVKLGVPVIASGGVASIDDIRELKTCGAEAAIIGRALYEGTVALKEAIEVAR